MKVEFKDLYQTHIFLPTPSPHLSPFSPLSPPNPTELPKKHCLLLRSAPKENLLDLCFSLSTDSIFVSAVVACRAYCFSPQELAGFALQRLSNDTYYAGGWREKSGEGMEKGGEEGGEEERRDVVSLMIWN